jgi:PPOX class probable F420-dependent enzyme
MALSEQLVALLRKPAVCYVSTTMPDGSPQITQTWVDTDGEHVVINIVQGMQKARNLERDPRLALVVSDPQAPSLYYQVRGRAVDVTAAGGADSIEALSHKYTGAPMPGTGSATKYGWW